MLHALTDDANKQSGQSYRSARACSTAGAIDAGQDRALAGPGNQAVLRRSVERAPIATRPSTAGIAERDCACGGSAGAFGACAQCRRKHLASIRQEREDAVADAASQRSHAAERRRSLSAHRCDADEDCEQDEPEFYRGPLGLARCDENTGQVKKFVFKEHCKGDCVDQHETEHVSNMSYCCSRFAACIKSAGEAGARAACQQKYYDYADSKWHTDYTECNAYTRESDCLAPLLAPCRFPDQDPDVESCCQELAKERDFVEKRKSLHCPGAVPPVCPFT